MTNRITDQNRISDHNIALLNYHEGHPEVSNYRLGKLFGITSQRVVQIINRDKRDQMVVEYFRGHPRASPAEVRAIFHISEFRVRRLQENPESINPLFRSRRANTGAANSRAPALGGSERLMIRQRGEVSPSVGSRATGSRRNDGQDGTGEVYNEDSKI